MTTHLAAFHLGTTTIAGTAFAESHSTEPESGSDMNSSSDMVQGAETSDNAASGAVDMEMHDVDVAAITAGEAGAMFSDDIVVGQAQRVLVDDQGNLIALIQVCEALEPEISAAQTPLQVETDGDESVLRVGITKVDLQAALDAQRS